jgi:CHAT domain-containing protein
MMSFHPWFTILMCFILGLSGCMKAAEKVVVPPTEAARIERNDSFDPDIPDEYRDRLRGVDAADWAITQIFLAVAGNLEAKGEEQKALYFLDRAAEAFAGKREASGGALVFCRKVILLLDAGREEQALALMREGEEKWTALPLRAFPEYLAGRLALMRGDFALAGDLLRQSLQDNTHFQTDVYLLQLKRDTELAAGMAAVLSDHFPRLLAAYPMQETQGFEKSLAGEGIAHLREAITLNRELRQTRIGPFIPAVDFQKVDAEAYAFLGLDKGMRGNEGESLLHLTFAAELSRLAGFREGEIRSLLFLGELGLGGENHIEGFRATEALLERADLYHAAPYRIWARLLLARYGREQGRIGEAMAVLQEAEGILSSQGFSQEVEMLDRICRRQRRAVYESLVELLAGEGRAGEALTAAEKAKTLAMADLLAGQDIGGTPAERELLGREAELGGTIRGLQRRILKVSGKEPTEELLERLKSTEETYRALLGRIGTEDEKLFSLISAHGIDPAALQRLLDENTTLFAYFVTERSLYAWAVHHEGLHLERIDISREELRRLVLSFREAIHSRDRSKTRSLSRKAYDLLLKPVIPYVFGERIGFIPDDSLVYLPFAAMSYRGKYLAEGFSIFHLSGAGMLEQDMAGKAPSGLRILAFGDPDLEDETLDLRHAVRELESIRKRIGGTTVLLRQQASEANVGEMLAGYDILHFAVRGQFNPDSPLRSGLLLTPGAGRDGTLSSMEIFRLRYSGMAVVMSGCDPLPEADPEGQGFSALQRAFLHAGSPSVVSTLWLVDDRAAARLLDLFYRQMRSKELLADSLRAAQLQMLREGHPPNVWAAFILTGRY